MLLRIGVPYKSVWLTVVCITVAFATDFMARVVYAPEIPPNAELCLLKFFGRILTRNKGSSMNSFNRKTSAKPRKRLSTFPAVSKLNDTFGSDVYLSNEVDLRANLSSSSERPEVRTEATRDYNASLLSLLLGKERFDLVKQTISNELSLFSYIKKFPRRIENIDKYIQLYTICSYLSPIISCEIEQVSGNQAGLLNYTSTLPSPEVPNIANNFPPAIPWVYSGCKWNVISGTYGDVICGKVFGGSKSIFPHNQDSVSFFLSTYRSFKSKEYSTFTQVSKTHETYPKYKQLEVGKSINVCVKSFRSANYPEYFGIWRDENFNLKLLERETWLSNLGNAKQIKFTPSQVFIAPKPAPDQKNQASSLVTNLNKRSPHTCKRDCATSIFDPSFHESHYPWNVLNKFWSSFMVMKRFIGPSFSDLSRFLLLDSVISWTELAVDNLLLWSVSLIMVIYLFFSALMSFTFTGSMLYQHCDLHANNLILLSDRWNITKNDPFLVPRPDIYFQEIILDIVSSSVKDVKIIDLTYLTHIDDKRRSLENVCKTNGEVSISDIESWQVFLYNFKRDVDQALSRHPSLPKAANSLSKLTQLFESDVAFNLTRPMYIGGSKFWWKNWIFNQNKFDDLYDSVMGVGHLFVEAIRHTESAILHNTNTTLFSPLINSLSEGFTNPIAFETYFKEVFYVPYTILTFGTCIYQHGIVKTTRASYFLVAVETLSHYFLVTSKSGSEKLPSWAENSQVGSNILWDKCIKSNSLFSRVVNSVDFPREFYYEPCFAEYCISRKIFPAKIKSWIQENTFDRKFFIYSFRKLAALSTNKISFALSVLVFNTIKHNLKENVLETPEKLVQISMSFSNSLSDQLINQLYQDRSTKSTQLFLEICMEEYRKHLLLFISLSTFNFGEKLCSKINKALFTYH